MNSSLKQYVRAAVLPLAVVVALCGCHPKVVFHRFQLINQSPWEITLFAVATSEAGLDSAPNRLAAPLPASAVADAEVDGPGQYWLRAIADVDGTPVEHIRGPVTMEDGNVGWAWRAEGDTAVEGVSPADLYAATDLPIVIIDTAGQEIPDDPKIEATMNIIDGEDGVNRPDPATATFSNLIGIELRGNSSQTFPKKSWGVELWDEAGEGVDAELLGMPEEEDWVFYGPWMDRSLIRNVLGYGLWNDLGYYAPRTRYCEVYLRDDPAVSIAESYQGLYVLTERIKRDGDRVDIARLEPENIREPEITGGYLLEIMRPSRLDADELGLPLSEGFVASVIYPNPDNINDTQQRWIQNHLNAFEDALFSPTFTNPESGYARFIDVDSFVDYMIFQEYFKNRDAFHSSTFLYKDRDDVIRMGPMWDLNIAMGYFSFQGLDGVEDWILNKEGGPIERSPWARRLLQDPAFRQRFIDRWTELRNGIFNTVNMNARIDAIVAELETAQARQFLRWKSLGFTLFPDIRYLMFAGPHPDSYQGEIEYLKTWLEDRAAWMEANIDSL